MTETIEVGREGRTPSKIVTGDALGRLESLLPDRRVIVVTDPNVDRLYGDLTGRFEKIVIGLGEGSKTLDTVGNIYRELIALDADRECFILAVGGGIVTDVAGFAASTYMRGVPFGFVATTLLAQVDASVGGKNGVNVEGYKNMAGTFNQPDFVICDTAMLSTLPGREFRAGMAEAIKAGIIADPDLFALFEKHTPEEFRSDRALLARAVAAAVKVKADIVERDEREAGERRKLNLGHTFAHAVEKTSRDFVHGEAVAIGLATIADIAVKMGELSEKEAQRIKGAVVGAGLPLDSGIDAGRLLKALRLDKKRDSDSVHLVVPTGIGSCAVRKTAFDELGRLFGE